MVNHGQQAMHSVHPPARNRRTPAQPLAALEIPDALLTIGTVAAATGLSERSIYRLASRGELVPPLRGNRCTRWRAADVRAWLAVKGSSASGGAA